MKLQHLLVAALRCTLPLAAAATLLLGMTSQALAQSATLTARNSSSRINIRSAPTVQSRSLRYGFAGDRVEVLRQTRGSDGYTWRRVRFSDLSEGWVRGDYVRVEASSGSSSVTSRQAARITTSSSGYTPEQINYFLEVAMGSEFGDATPKIKKWNGPIRIQVKGSPTPQDLETLNAVIREINLLTQGRVSVSLDDQNPNLEFYFVPEPEFGRYEPNYQPPSTGFTWAHWSNNIITDARILVTTVGISQRERSSIIREELTQALGLMRDSFTHKDSIFFQGWSEPIEYAAIDKVLVEMLYRREIQPGMSKADVMRVLSKLKPEAGAASILSDYGLTNAEPPIDFSLENDPVHQRR